MIPNYWRALIKRGDITEKDYLEKVAPCNVLIKRAKERLISKFLKDLNSMIKAPTQWWVKLDLRDKWEAKLKE